MKVITEAIKITIKNTAKKINSGYFAKNKNITEIKQKIEKVIETQEFKNFKVIVETGAAVGGIIVSFTQYANPPISTKDVEDIHNQLELLKKMIEEGLNTEDIETTIIEKDNTVAELKQKIEIQQEIHKTNQNTIHVQSIGLKCMTCVLAIGLLLALKPAKALELINEIIENDD